MLGRRAAKVSGSAAARAKGVRVRDGEAGRSVVHERLRTVIPRREVVKDETVDAFGDM